MGKKKDLTRIEDLSEFLHEKDTTTERKLDEQNLADSTLPDTPINDLNEEEVSLSDTLVGEKGASLSDTAVGEEGASLSDTAVDVSLEDSNEQSTEVEFTSEIKPGGEELLETFDESEMKSPEIEGTAVDFTQEEVDFNTEDSPNIPSAQEESPSMDTLNEPVEFNSEESEEAFSTKAEPIEEVQKEVPKSTEDLTQEDLPAALQEVKTESSEKIPEDDGEESPPPLPRTARPSFSTKDQLGEIKKFAESITFHKVEMGSNPPFSVMLKNIKYLEDVEDIRIILREHGLLDQKNEKEIEQSLGHGSILISQISEYSAIYLAHRFRRFDVDINMGLSDELHPSESYDHDSRGLISKENIKQNHSESANLIKADTSKIILATTPEVEGYKILRHIDVITEHSIIEQEELEAIEGNRPHKLYQGLGEKLKIEAQKRQGNAVVGVNYQFTPLSETPDHPTRYKVTCSGNVVLMKNEHNPD